MHLIFEDWMMFIGLGLISGLLFLSEHWNVVGMEVDQKRLDQQVIFGTYEE
jgi:hypothetical protein